MPHELDSVMLFVHPPIAIAGHVMTFAYTVLLFLKIPRRRAVLAGVAAWLLVLLGLVTGMLWAWSAWGSPWSWDPKETAMLLLFLALTGALGARIEGRKTLARWLALTACLLSICTVLVSFLPAGLHSFVGG